MYSPMFLREIKYFEGKQIESVSARPSSILHFPFFVNFYHKYRENYKILKFQIFRKYMDGN